MDNQRAVIFVNGRLPSLKTVRKTLQPGDWLVAADGGLRYLQRLGLKPDILVGDLDSVTAEDVEGLQRLGVRIERYPVNKDETDLELALQLAIAEGFRSIRIAAALGGRLDQTLGNLFLLMSPTLAEYDVRLEDGRCEVFIIRKEAEIIGRAGDLVSLLPLSGPACGTWTEGLQYPLKGETLFQERTRGISNVMIAGRAQAGLQKGMLLCIHTRKSSLN